MHWESLAARCSCSIQNADDCGDRCHKQIADKQAERSLGSKLLQGLVDLRLVVQLQKLICRTIYFKPGQGSPMPNNTKRTLVHRAETLGQDVIEFPLVAVLIALGCAMTMSNLDMKILVAFITVGTKITASV
jgi:Flp pilus assembly pilin Flp